MANTYYTGLKTEVIVAPTGQAIDVTNFKLGNISDLDIFQENIQELKYGKQ